MKYAYLIGILLATAALTAEAAPSPEASLLSWRSVYNHAEVGEVAIDLTREGEVRFGGLARLQAEFTAPVAVATSSVLARNVATGASTTLLVSISEDGKTLTLLPEGPVLAGCFEVSLESAALGATGLEPLRVRVLAGDVDGSGKVTTEDARLVKSNIGLPITPDTAKYDLNHNGSITFGDVLLTMSRSGNTAVCSQ